MAGGGGSLQFCRRLIPDFSSKRTILGSAFVVIAVSSVSKQAFGNLMTKSQGNACGAL
jgi:hypothetical protein